MVASETVLLRSPSPQGVWSVFGQDFVLMQQA